MDMPLPSLISTRFACRAWSPAASREAHEKSFVIPTSSMVENKVYLCRMYKLIKLFSICMLFACSPQKSKTDPIIQTGDLLFQQWDQSDFAKAINAVTEGADDEDYAHVGLVLSIDDNLQILEAVTGKGVILRPLQSFLDASLDETGEPRVAIGRLRKDYSAAIPDINRWAAARVGMAYDSLFVYGNDKYYCSELIHDAFNQNVAGGDVFELAPMTFKDPETGKYFPVWVDYFQKYNEAIPEGKPGINPGLMSRSDKIEIVNQLWN